MYSCTLLFVPIVLTLCRCSHVQGTDATAGAKEKLVPPVIDISPLIFETKYNDKDRAFVREAIFDASSRWGFFQVVNHGIDNKLQEDLLGQMKQFFYSPINVKNTVKRTESNSRGFADDELTKRLKDVKEIFDVGQVPYTSDQISADALENQHLDGYNQWPAADKYTHLREFKPVVDAYYAACLRLSHVLVRAMSTLIPCSNETYFERAFDHHSSFLRLNYYPVLTDGVDAGAVTEKEKEDKEKCSAGDSAPCACDSTPELPPRLGVSRHTDAGALTILLQDPNPEISHGLEVGSVFVY
jgi:isopenicillin N synthase-like dioxygenase